MGLAAFAAAPLAACGSDDEPRPPGPEATPEAPSRRLPSVATVKATKTPKPGKSPSAEPTKTAAGEADSPKATPKATPKAPATGGKLVKDGDTPLAAAADIPANSGARSRPTRYIVTQPTAGKYVGFDSLCTHEGCSSTCSRQPGTWSARATDRSSTSPTAATSGPAEEPMPKKEIIVEDGQIYKAKKA